MSDDVAMYGSSYYGATQWLPVVVVIDPPGRVSQLQCPVTGPVTATIYADSSSCDTDFIVRLVDVYPDGTAYNLTEGILRARFRASIWEPEQLMEPGTVYAFEIDMMATSNVFLPGHRIRVHVTSSNFPLWDRNPNTGHPQGQDAELVSAKQTLHCGPDRPSHVMLSVAE